MPTRPTRDNFQLSHLVQFIVFFLLALNAFALLYLVLDSNRVFTSLASARIAGMAGSNDSSQPSIEDAAAEVPTLAPTLTASSPSIINGKALTMLGLSPISTTGACQALENFKNPIQIQSAKALLSSGPLAQKSWMVSTPIPASFLAGIEVGNVNESRKISKALAERGVEPLSSSAQFVGLAKADTAASALELATVLAGGMDGVHVVARQVSAASERKSIVTLPQTRVEIQFATTLSSRLPGVSLVPVPCPAAAAPLLAVRAPAG